MDPISTSLGELLSLFAVGAWLGMDAAAFLQLMVSQPLVAGWLGGLIVGDPASGLLVGIVLQVVWSRALPMGVAGIPSMGPAALAAGAIVGRGAAHTPFFLGSLRVPDAVTLAVALAVALAVGELGRLGVREIGRRRTGVIRRALAAADRADVTRLFWINLSGAVPSALLGALLAAGGVVAGYALLSVTAGLPSLDGRWVALPLVGFGVGQVLSLTERGRWLARRVLP